MAERERIEKIEETREKLFWISKKHKCKNTKIKILSLDSIIRISFRCKSAKEAKATVEDIEEEACLRCVTMRIEQEKNRVVGSGLLFNCEFV